MSFFMEYTSLVWLFAGILLIFLELMIPGGFVLLLMGMAALTLSLVTFLTPFGWVFQLGLFVLATLMYTLLLKENLKKIFRTRTYLNDPENEFIGKKAKALTDINDLDGKIEFKGTQWPATSESLILRGDEVEIIHQESINLHVKPIKD